MFFVKKVTFLTPPFGGGPGPLPYPPWEGGGPGLWCAVLCEENVQIVWGGTQKPQNCQIFVFLPPFRGVIFGVLHLKNA